MPINTVLFDIGNVLSHDGHETYLTHEAYGLTLGLGLPKQEITQKVSRIFRKYAVLPKASESDFWREISETLGIKLTPGDIAAVKKQITITNPEAIASFDLLKEHGIKIGIISNSLSFFYNQQTEPLLFDRYTDPDLLFLSHKMSHLKSDGLFELAAQKLDPATTFVIEDRLKNVEYARNIGFHATVYSLGSGKSLLALTKKLIAENSGS